MAVEIVLLKKVVNLGNTGDIVAVKEGYARNFLLVRGLAKLATEEAKQEAEKMRVEEAKKKQEKLKDEAAELLKRLKKEELIVQRKVKDEKLYGSVREVDMVKLLKEKGFEFEKNQVKITKEVKALGDYEVIIKPFPGLEEKFTLKVKEEK